MSIGRTIKSFSDELCLGIKPSSVYGEGVFTTNFTRHQGEVYEIDFSPDGELIASTSLDRTIKLWRADGAVLGTLSGHTAPIYDVVFAPGGKTLVSGGLDKTIRFWQLDWQQDRFEIVRTLTIYAHEASINDLDISEDGNLIASVSHDRFLKLWHPNGHLVKSIVADQTGLRTVAIAPDRPIIASGGKDQDVKLWTPQGELITTLIGHQAIVLDVEFSPNGEFIASASADKTIKIWDPFQYGCNWVRDYLKTNAEFKQKTSRTQLCQ